MEKFPGAPSRRGLVGNIEVGIDRARKSLVLQGAEDPTYKQIEDRFMLLYKRRCLLSSVKS